MLWAKGIGLDSCFMGVAFLQQVAKSKLIIDPFCGIGTVLAMANALGKLCFTNTRLLQYQLYHNSVHEFMQSSQ